MASFIHKKCKLQYLFVFLHSYVRKKCPFNIISASESSFVTFGGCQQFTHQFQENNFIISFRMREGVAGCYQFKYNLLHRQSVNKKLDNAGSKVAMRGRVWSDVRPRPIKLEDKTFMFLFSAILKADAKVRCLLERCQLTHPQNDTSMRISFKQHFILHISRVVHEKSSSQTRIWRVKNLNGAASIVRSAEGLMNRYSAMPGEFISTSFRTRQSFQEK